MYIYNAVMVTCDPSLGHILNKWYIAKSYIAIANEKTCTCSVIKSNNVMYIIKSLFIVRYIQR